MLHLGRLPVIIAHRVLPLLVWLEIVYRLLSGLDDMRLNRVMNCFDGRLERVMGLMVVADSRGDEKVGDYMVI